MHVFNQKEVIDNYNTIFVDIYGTKSMNDFIFELQNAFLKAPFAKSKKGLKEVLNLIQRVYFQLNFTPGGEIGSARVGLMPFQGLTMSLTEMFDFLEKTDKPNIVVFDEFQKIKEYPEDAAAIIRSHVQRMNNTHFIFCGSSRHMMHKMFEYSNEPFYRSAKSLDLDIIPLKTYTDFCKRIFALYDKSIDEDAIKLVYNLFSGNTYDMQEIMKDIFSDTARKKNATVDTVLASLNNLLDAQDQNFRDNLDKLSNMADRRVLICIAMEGIATGLTSSASMKKYRLDNASSVQNALLRLTDDKVNLVRGVGKANYMLQNRLFEYWFARRNMVLDAKIQMAEARFNKERELSNPDTFQ